VAAMSVSNATTRRLKATCSTKSKADAHRTIPVLEPGLFPVDGLAVNERAYRLLCCHRGFAVQSAVSGN
jgi:hypothetical protein